jgi:hypothetical protein
MSLPSSGQIAISQVRSELGFAGTTDFGLAESENLIYCGLNTLSISASGNQLSLSNPSYMNDWYGYTHNLYNDYTVSSTQLKAPYDSANPTFATYDMGTNDFTVSFTASNFSSSGAPPNSNVPYSVYYGQYGNYSNFIKSGVLTSGAPSDSFSFSYSSFGQRYVTFYFGTTASVPTPLFKYDVFSSSYNGGSTLSNLGTLGSSYNLTLEGSVGIGGNGAGTYAIMNTGSVAGKFSGNSVTLQQSQWAISAMVKMIAWKTDGSLWNIVEVTDRPSTYSILSGSANIRTNGQRINGSTRFNQTFNTYAGGTAAPRWYHIVFQKDYSTEYLYVNGVYQSGNDSYVQTMSDPVIAIGGGVGNGATWTTSSIYMGSVSIWTGSVLTEGQIDKLYQEFLYRFTVPT